MDRRTFLAIFISLIIILVWHLMFSRPATPPQKAAPPTATAPIVQTPKAETPAESQSAAAAPELQSLVAEQADQPLQELNIKTPLYNAILTNKGARLKSWLLQEYYVYAPQNGDWWELTKNKLLGRYQKRPLEMVSAEALSLERYPLGLKFEDEQLTQRVNNAIWRVEDAQTTVTPSHPAQVKLSYSDPSGWKFTKTFTFPADNYKPQIAIGVENISDTKRQLKYYLTWDYSLGKESAEGNDHSYSGPVFLEGESLTQPKADAAEPFKHQGAISWAGLQNAYFAALFIPQEVTSELLVQRDGAGNLSLGLSPPAAELALNQQISHKFDVYAGPQKEETLKQAGRELDKIVDYGWFAILAKPLKEVLKFFNSFTGNYGIDIILLTIVFKLVFWPLTASSFKSMQSMQQVQPKMAQLRKKHKDDPQTLNREIMELYKKHKVNPLGGCMPMLLQIPVFFALYKVLMVSIELRHAHFLPVWITDLSAHDPVFILPVLTGASMFLQQKMTPSTGDPSQAKIMMLMPLIFTFMFLKFPSGLVLYWFVNNLLTIWQQYLNQKKHGSPAEA